MDGVRELGGRGVVVVVMEGWGGGRRWDRGELLWSAAP